MPASNGHLSKLKMLILLSLLLLVVPGFAQWSQDWTSPALGNALSGGWLALSQSSPDGTYRFYTIDTTAFRIMSAPYSSTPQHTYTFTPAERLAGEYIYSLSVDLTGDNVDEFYVVAYTGAASPYRQSFRIVNIVNGVTLFQRDDPAYSFGTPTLWDIDGDGSIECEFTRAPYPSGIGYDYQVFDTGVNAVSPVPVPVPLHHALEQNHPNPFNASTNIRFELHEPGLAAIVLYNQLGQRVRELIRDHRPSGRYAAAWDGKDDSGRSVASGPYYYSLELNSIPQQTRRMILLR